MQLTPSEVLKRWMANDIAFDDVAEPFSVFVPRLEAAPYRDIVDALLYLKGQRNWSWQDASGRSSPGQGLTLSVSRLVGDALALPVQLLLHEFAARRCIAHGRHLKTPALDAGGLYLRMDHLFDLHSGGSVAHVAGVINAMRPRLSRLSVLSTDDLAAVEKDPCFHVLTPAYGRGRNIPLIPNLTYTRQVVDWWRRSGLPHPGFIYGRYSVGNYAGPELRRILNVPYVCEYNGSAIWIARNWGGKPLRFERIFRLVEDANLHGADLIIAVSEASKVELMERGYRPERILVNPNGVDPELYRPDLSGRPVRERLGIAAEEIVIGFIGTFGRWHGAEVLADAFALLLDKRPDLRMSVRLLLVGDGMTMPETRRRLESNGAIDRAVLTGLVPQSEGPFHLAACDVLASPHVPNDDESRFFGSPTKLFEYMAMGRAIVASDLDQIGEILEHEKSALLVRPGDAHELASSLERVVDSEGLRQKLAAAACAEALKNYTWSAHVGRILDRLKALVEEGSPK